MTNSPYTIADIFLLLGVMSDLYDQQYQNPCYDFLGLRTAIVATCVTICEMRRMINVSRCGEILLVVDFAIFTLVAICST